MKKIDYWNNEKFEKSHVVLKHYVHTWNTLINVLDSKIRKIKKVSKITINIKLSGFLIVFLKVFQAWTPGMKKLAIFTLENTINHLWMFCYLFSIFVKCLVYQFFRVRRYFLILWKCLFTVSINGVWKVSEGYEKIKSVWIFVFYLYPVGNVVFTLSPSLLVHVIELLARWFTSKVLKAGREQ